jgi:hypothetical protein
MLTVGLLWQWGFAIRLDKNEAYMGVIYLLTGLFIFCWIIFVALELVFLIDRDLF